MNGELSLFLDGEGISYINDASMKEYTTIRVGGCAECMIFPRTQDELIRTVDYLCYNKNKYKIIGRMSNILPCDQYYGGALVNTANLCGYMRCGTVVKAECGVLFPTLLARMSAFSLGGLEALALIPGTVGGMITSNAGAFGGEISDFLIDVDVYSPSEGRRMTLTTAELNFSYRSSSVKDTDYVILSAKFLFENKSTDVIARELQKNALRRRSTQPIGKPSLGSIFRKTDFTSAGYYIERCGLKGYSVGDAEISKKHAGFIINNGNATAEDVKKLILLVKDAVFEKFGIRLAEEIEYLK